MLISQTGLGEVECRKEGGLKTYSMPYLEVDSTKGDQIAISESALMVLEGRGPLLLDKS